MIATVLAHGLSEGFKVYVINEIDIIIVQL